MSSSKLLPAPNAACICIARTHDVCRVMQQHLSWHSHWHRAHCGHGNHSHNMMPHIGRLSGQGQHLKISGIVKRMSE